MKKKFQNKRVTSLILCMMLVVAMAFLAAGCGKGNQSDKKQPTENVGTESQKNVLGEGKTKILFTVVDKDKNETSFEIHTDKEMVGEALLENNLIAGEEGEYGLFVKQVNGITADYDVDGTYWAFYVNGEYASAAVDMTPVKEGETYSFKVEK